MQYPPQVDPASQSAWDHHKMRRCWTIVISRLPLYTCREWRLPGYSCRRVVVFEQKWVPTCTAVALHRNPQQSLLPANQLVSAVTCPRPLTFKVQLTVSCSAHQFLHTVLGSHCRTMPLHVSTANALTTQANCGTERVLSLPPLPLTFKIMIAAERCNLTGGGTGAPCRQRFCSSSVRSPSRVPPLLDWPAGVLPSIILGCVGALLGRILLVSREI